MDSALVVKAQRGDQRAFEALATASHSRLQRTAVGILRDPYLAEDAVQQALLAIWRDLRQLRDPDRFEAWSYRLLVRACYAEAKRRPQWMPDDQMRSSNQPVAADAYGAVIWRDALESAFVRLSVDQRAVVVLHHLMSLTQDQVAEVLQVPAGTVYSRLSRAIGTLRAALEANARPGPRRSIHEGAVR
jgi:RNA polymerase sigma-70 factor (ECF subfamily)